MSGSVWKIGVSRPPPERFEKSERSMRVRLTRKLADCLDGVDLSAHSVGDVLRLTPHEAELLTAEGWGDPISDPQPREAREYSSAFVRAEAADAQRFVNERLRRIGEEIEQHELEAHLYRRIEDRLREEIHDARARIVRATTRTVHRRIQPRRR